VEFIGNQRPQTTAENRVVIDDEDSYHGFRIMEWRRVGYWIPLATGAESKR
jgi:hypothetical protein